MKTRGRSSAAPFDALATVATEAGATAFVALDLVGEIGCR